MSDVPDYLVSQELVKQKAIEVKYKDYSQTNTVTSGSLDNVFVYANNDTIWDVISMYLTVPSPSGASSGTHMFEVRSSEKALKFFEGASTYNRWIVFMGGQWTQVSKRRQPWSASAGAQILGNMVLTEGEGLKIKYENNTDVDQTGKRTIKVAVKEVTIQ